MANVQYKVSSPVEYEDKHGEKKTVWVPLGRGFTTKSGSIMVKLNALPVGANPTIILKEDDGSYNNRGRGGGNRGGGRGYDDRDAGGNRDNRGGGYDDGVPF